MKFSIRLLDYFFVLRPTLFFAVWTVSLAGLWAQNRFAEFEHSAPTRLLMIGSYDVTYVLWIALFTLIMGGVFILNQVHDFESDHLNNKLFLIANGEISRQAANIESVIIIAIPLAIAFWLRPIVGVSMLLTFVVTGWIYSIRPFRWKNRPILGLFTNMTGYLLVFSTGWLIYGIPEKNLWLHSLPYILGITAVYFFTTIPDINGDKKTNKITVAVQYGANKTIWFGFLCNVAAVITSALLKDFVIFIPTVLAMPFFIYSVFKKSNEQVLRTNKYGTLFLSIVICVRYPIYFLIIFFIFFFSKWYYKIRFGINYPSFKSS